MSGMEQIVLIGIFLVLLYLFARSRAKAKRAKARYRVAYAHFAQAAADADEDLLAQFDGMLPSDPDGVTLLRLSILNRGDREVPADHFEGPIAISLPASTRVLDAAPSSSNGGKIPIDGIAIDPALNRLEIQPFELPVSTSVIFSIVVDGAAEPLDVSGRFRMQDSIVTLVETYDT